MPRTKPTTRTIEIGPTHNGWESVTAYEFQKFTTEHRPRLFSDVSGISEPATIRFHYHTPDGGIKLVARVWLYEDYSDAGHHGPYIWQPNVYEIRHDGGI